MKTQIKNAAIILIAAAIYITMSSCSTGKGFTSNMKYTYYKKVKAHGHDELSSKSSKEKSAKPDSSIDCHTSIPLCSIIVNKGNDTCKQKSLIKAIKKETTMPLLACNNPNQKIQNNKDKIKKIYNKKILPFYASNSNTLAADGGNNIMLKIMIVISIIILAYILLILLIMGLFEAAGGFSIGC